MSIKENSLAFKFKLLYFYNQSYGMKKLYLLVLFVIANLAYAQEFSASTTDSINTILKGKSTKERCDYFLKNSEIFSNTNINLSYLFAKKALNEALKSNDNALVALTYNSLGNVHQYRADSDSALIFHSKALQYRRIIRDSVGISDSYNNIGIAYDTKGDFENALKNYFKALKIYEIKKDDEKTAMTLTNIGIVYKAQKEYKKSYYYYKRANVIYTKIKSDFGMTATWGNLGGILINFKDYDKSIVYSTLAREGYTKLGYKRYVAYPISNIAVAYDSLHRFKEANKNYIESIALHQEFENDFEVANISSAYANCLIKQKRYEESISFGEKALKYAKIANANFIEVCAIDNLAKAYGKLGVFEKAYYYSALHKSGMDDLFKAEKTKAVFELEAKYENEKKSKLLLQIQNKIERRNTVVLILSLLIFSVALISYLIYRQQKIKSKQKDQEFELKSAIAAIAAQNKMQDQRIQISRDLHDNIGAQLTFIISSINNLTHVFDLKNSGLEDKLEQISKFTKSTIIELRDTIWAMNTKDISVEDLKLRIYNFIEKAKLAEGKINFKFEIDSKLSTAVFSSVDGMNIYRVVQEALHNSIKHAEATEIAVEFKKHNDLIIIKITDNGKGFDINAVNLGNGMYNMKKRIKEIHGVILIESEANQGTTIQINIPY